MTGRRAAGHLDSYRAAHAPSCPKNGRHASERVIELGVLESLIQRFRAYSSESKQTMNWVHASSLFVTSNAAWRWHNCLDILTYLQWYDLIPIVEFVAFRRACG